MGILGKERVTSQYNSARDTVDAQAAREVEEKELKRKTTVKEKERATGKTAENQSDPTSPATSESKNEDKNWLSLLDVESSKSIAINNEAMTIGGNNDDDLNMTSEQKSLVNSCNVD